MRPLGNPSPHWNEELVMWIEVEADGEYLNADMVERVTVENSTPRHTCHLGHPL